MLGSVVCSKVWVRLLMVVVGVMFCMKVEREGRKVGVVLFVSSVKMKLWLVVL